MINNIEYVKGGIENKINIFILILSIIIKLNIIDLANFILHMFLQ